ncbi:hypothetical protein DV735_g392, partial [Chaetothyriales sp. CBS 134920]
MSSCRLRGSAALDPLFWAKFKHVRVSLELRTKKKEEEDEVVSIYLAQCPLTSLPDVLQADLPTPELVLKAGKGDVYASSLWLGHASAATAAYTPLHRDPNPNLFLQLAGCKEIRLLPPEVGDVLFDAVREEEALFIPKHWWHSVKGVGGGVTASANWWFR